MLEPEASDPSSADIDNFDIENMEVEIVESNKGNKVHGETATKNVEVEIAESNKGNKIHGETATKNVTDEAPRPSKQKCGKRKDMSQFEVELLKLHTLEFEERMQQKRDIFEEEIKSIKEQHKEKLDLIRLQQDKEKLEIFKLKKELGLKI